MLGGPESGVRTAAGADLWHAVHVYFRFGRVPFGACEAGWSEPHLGAGVPHGTLMLTPRQRTPYRASSIQLVQQRRAYRLDMNQGMAATRTTAHNVLERYTRCSSPLRTNSNALLPPPGGGGGSPVVSTPAMMAINPKIAHAPGSLLWCKGQVNILLWTQRTSCLTCAAARCQWLSWQPCAC